MIFLLDDYSPIKPRFHNVEEYFILISALLKVQEEIKNGSIHIGTSSNSNKSSNLKIVEYIGNELWTQGIVGVIKTSVEINNDGDPGVSTHQVQIIIKSRFDRDGEKPYFLAKMFESTDLKVSDHLSECS